MIDEGLSLPALKGRQGDRTIYVVLPAHQVLEPTFTPDVVRQEERDQRALNVNHARGIADYIVDNRADYVLGALTYALDVEVDFDVLPGQEQLGILRLPAGVRLRSVDGQHRREGIRMAVSELAEVARDNIAVVLYVEEGLTERRQMFSDMNWTARKVTASQNVAFDSRDTFARVVQQLVRNHPLLEGRVEEQLARVARGSACLFTLAAVYDAVRRLQVGVSSRTKSASAFDEEAVYDRAFRFFTLLGSRAELREATTSEQLAELRVESILISSTTLRVIAGAVFGCITYQRQQSTPFRLEDLHDPLCAVDFSPEADIWQQSGFVTPGRSTPNARNQEVARASARLTSVLLDQL